MGALAQQGADVDPDALFRRIALLETLFSGGSANIGGGTIGELRVQPALRKWATAYGKMRNGVRNARLLLIGDSTTAGSGGNGTAGFTAGGRPFCPGVKLARALRDAGATAYASGAYGNPATLSNAQFTAWDPRFSGTGWGPATSPQAGAWLRDFTSSTATETISFTPAESVDTFVIWYITNSGSRVFSYAVDGGAATNVDANNASTLMQSVTVAAGSVGTHALTLTKVSGLGNRIYAIQAYDSTTKAIEVIPWGISGARAQDGVASTNAYDSLTFLKTMAPDLTVINLCINEWVNAGSVASFQSNLALIVAAAQVSGDVIVQTGVPSQAATYPLATQQVYVDAAIQVGIAAGAAIDDTWRKFQSNERDASIYSDGIHPNGSGYEVMVANARQICRQ